VDTFLLGPITQRLHTQVHILNAFIMFSHSLADYVYVKCMEVLIKLLIFQCYISEHSNNDIPYKNKYWRGTKFSELANHHTTAKFKSRQYFFYSISIVTLVAFEWFCQINILPNSLFQQIAKYYIHQYLFLYGISILPYKMVSFLPSF